MVACSLLQGGSRSALNNQKDKSSSLQQVGMAKRTIAVYYSLGGSTDRLAKRISRQTNIKSVRINAANRYPTDDNDAINQRVQRESSANQFDNLTGVPNDLSKYDTVLVGFPIWSNDVAYPVQSFLSQNSKLLAGKRVIPFSTSAMADSSAIQNTVRTIRRLVPDSNVDRGLNVTSDGGTNSARRTWINNTVFATSSSKRKKKTASSRNTRVTYEVNNKSFDGYLNDSQASQELIKRLPLVLTFKTFAEGYPEKFSRLDRALPSNKMTGHAPQSGDIDYNSNNQSLFMYYGDVGRFDELHNVGRITSPSFQSYIQDQSGNVRVKISR